MLEDVGDSFPVLETHCLDYSVQNYVLHVSVHEADHLVGLFLVWEVFLVCTLHYCVLVVVVQDEKVTCLVLVAFVVYQNSLESRIPEVYLKFYQYTINAKSPAVHTERIMYKINLRILF